MKFLKEILIGVGVAIVGYLTWQGYNLLPILIFAGLVYFLMHSAGLRGFARRSVAAGVPATDSPVTFGDVGGQATAKKELVEALDFVLRRQEAERLGIRPLKGILLIGPPGTGKTLLAKAAANYTGSAFLATSGSDFVEIYAGVGAQRVRQLFKQARDGARSAQKKSAIIFIDEIEVLGGKRGQHTSHLEYDQTLNQLLVEMDGIAVNDDVRVLVVGATNRYDLLDPALLRPGRFDRIVSVDLPDRDGRLQILQLHTRNKPLAPEVDLEGLAKETFGFSGAHLESLANEAAIMALREGRDQLLQRDFEEAIDKVIMGEKLERRPTDAERERIAYHEGGHALLAELVRPGSVSSMSITSRGGTLGHVRHVPEDDFYLATREYLEGQIRVALAGALSEELIYGNRSTGAANDFAQALDNARKIVLSGLSDLGIVDEETLPPASLYRAMRGIISAQETAARAELKRHEASLRALAARLIAEETISGDEVRRIIGEAVA